MIKIYIPVVKSINKLFTGKKITRKKANLCLSIFGEKKGAVLQSRLSTLLFSIEVINNNAHKCKYVNTC